MLCNMYLLLCIKTNYYYDYMYYDVVITNSATWIWQIWYWVNWDKILWGLEWRKWDSYIHICTPYTPFTLSVHLKYLCENINATANGLQRSDLSLSFPMRETKICRKLNQLTRELRLTEQPWARQVPLLIPVSVSQMSQTLEQPNGLICSAGPHAIFFKKKKIHFVNALTTQQTFTS